MAVISATEQLGVYDGLRDFSGPDAATRSFVVKTDTVMSSIEAIDGAQLLGVDPLPRFGDVLFTGSLLVARRIQAGDGGNKLRWLMSVEYQPRDPLEFEDEAEADKPPDERKAQISWNFTKYLDARDVDARGKAYNNSAGDPLGNPPKFTLPGMQVTIKQHQTAFDPVALLPYVGTTNDQLFLGAPEDSLMFLPGTSTREFAEGKFYFLVTYKFEYRADLWQPVNAIDRGKRVLDETTGLPIAAADGNGVVAGVVINLDGNGHAVLPPALGGELHFLEFYPFKQSDFSGLPLRLF